MYGGFALLPHSLLVSKQLASRIEIRPIFAGNCR